jgi:uncharacterized protein (TIGR03437 family)
MITSGAYLGTPFTVDTTSSIPPWLTLKTAAGTNATAGGTASDAGVPMTVQAVATTAGCGTVNGGLAGTASYTVSLASSPVPAASEATFKVVINVVNASTLTATTPNALTVTRGGTSASNVTSTVSNSGASAVPITLSSASLPTPDWLNVVSVTPSSVPATGGGSTTVTFNVTQTVATLATGTYTANVHFLVANSADVVIPVTLQVDSAVAGLALQNTSSTNVTWAGTTSSPTVVTSWVAGTPFAPIVIDPISTSATPLSYTVTPAASFVTSLAYNSGVAYNFASPFSVSLSTTAAAGASPGTDITGNVVLVGSDSTTITVGVTVHVLSAAATISSISPTGLPQATTGTFYVTLTGTGFVTSGSQATQVGVVNPANGLMLPDAAITTTVVNATTITLALNASTANSYLPFNSSNGSVTLGVCNGTSCTTPTSHIVLSFGNTPSVQLVTSASAFIAPTSPALLAVAPYDVLSVFGTNFCPASVSTCTSNLALYGQLDPTTFHYSTSLSPDATGTVPMHNLMVSFYQHGTATWIADAPLLFANAGQINILAPAALAAYTNNQEVDLVVSFGYGSPNPSTYFKSTAYPVTVAATDPGIFAITGNGQGDAAALDVNGALVNSSSPARSRLTGAASEIIQLYVTGLGVPDSDGTTAEYNGATCMTAAAYFPLVSSGFTSDDGLVLQPSLYPTGLIQPCMKTAPTVTIGGVAANAVEYAGWVSGSVAGLYQVNVQLPAYGGSFFDSTNTAVTFGASAVSMPVVITEGGRSSQPTGVNISVIKSLTATSSVATATCKQSDGTCSAITFSATGGAGSGYVFSSSTAGFTADSGGASLTLSNKSKALGTYTVVISVTDATNTDTVSISVTVVAS